MVRSELVVAPDIKQVWRPLVVIPALVSIPGLVASCSLTFIDGKLYWQPFALCVFVGLLLGASSAIAWLWGPGTRGLVVDEIGIQETKRGRSSRFWPHSEITRIDLVGSYGWRELLTAVPASEFPYLRIRTIASEDGVSILLWGRKSTQRIQTQIIDLWQPHGL